MSVLVDTCVWSLALRRGATSTHPAVAELADLISEGRALMLGLIRQELLSGVRTPAQFDELRAQLRAFPDLRVRTADHEEAASFFNRCRSKGVQGSTIDLLICAVAARRNLPVFTTDGDFARYAKILPVRLHTVRS